MIIWSPIRVTWVSRVRAAATATSPTGLSKPERAGKNDGRKISGFVTEAPREFLAVTFVLLSARGTVDPDVLALYLNLKGIKQ